MYGYGKICKDFGKDEIKVPVQEGKPEKNKEPEADNLFVADLEQALMEAFQTRVQIKINKKNKGMIQIEFFDLNHLQALLDHWKITVN